MPAGPASPTSQGARSAGRHTALEGLRGVAALAVFGFHAWLYTRAHVLAVAGSGLDDAILSRLRIGLVLFFVLSGFLLYGPWVRAGAGSGPRPALGRYARRRLARVVPAYYLAIAASAALLWPLAGAPGVRLPPVEQLPLFLVFAQNQSADTVLRLDAPTWTLAIEASFYLVLPLLGWLALRWRSTIRGLVGVPLAMLVLGVAYNWVLSRDPTPTQTLSKSLPAMLPYFALGMLTAVATEQRRVSSAAATRLVLGGAVLVIADAWLHALTNGAFGLGGVLRVSRDLIAAAGFAAIIAGALVRPPRILLWRPLTFTGEVSYGLFLWHVPILLVLRGNGLLPLHVAAAAAVALPLSIAAGWLSWRYVEQPAIAWSAGRRREPPSGDQRAEPAEELAPVPRP